MKIPTMKQERSRYLELFCSDPLHHFYSGITIIQSMRARLIVTQAVGGAAMCLQLVLGMPRI